MEPDHGWFIGIMISERFLNSILFFEHLEFPEKECYSKNCERSFGI